MPEGRISLAQQGTHFVMRGQTTCLYSHLSVDQPRKHAVEADAKPKEVALPAAAVQIDCEDQQLFPTCFSPEKLELGPCEIHESEHWNAARNKSAVSA